MSLLPLEDASGFIRLVAQLLNGFSNALLDVCADVVAAIDDAGNSHLRDTGLTGDVADRDLFA